MPEGAGSICRAAAEAIEGDRADKHGDMRQCHENIAALWSAWLGVPVTAHDVAIMMALLKAARTKTGAHNPDDHLDMVGYAAIAGELRS